MYTTVMYVSLQCFGQAAASPLALARSLERLRQRTCADWPPPSPSHAPGTPALAGCQLRHHCNPEYAAERSTISGDAGPNAGQFSMMSTFVQVLEHNTYRTERRSIFHDEYICTETYRTTCREYETCISVQNLHPRAELVQNSSPVPKTDPGLSEVKCRNELNYI